MATDFLECDVLEKVDYDLDLFDMDFSDKLRSGITLQVGDPTVTWLFEDGTTPAAGTEPVAANFVRNGGNTIWQFEVSGGTNGVAYVVRVQAVGSDGRAIEGNGILKVGVPCVIYEGAA